jgi:hypothetical protein
MKLRSLILASVVLLALVGTLYWSEHRKPKDETVSANASPSILKLDQGTITSVALKKNDAEPIVLTKGDSGSWKITEPKPFGADQSAVSGMLSTLSSLNSERVVEDKASDLKPYGLEPAALEVDVKERDNKSQKLLLGDDTPTGNAVYASLAGDPRIFTVPSYNKGSIDKSVNDLRDKRLITLEPDKISRLELVRNNQTIEFGRNKDEWQILKPKPLRADSTEVGSVVRKLTDAHMDLSGSSQNEKETASAFAKATPVATAKVTDESGTEELQIRKNKDTYYAKSSVVDGVYKVDSDLGTAVNKGLDDFRNKKIFDFGFNDPDKVDINAGSKQYDLSKGGTDWWWNGKKMDPENVETLIAKLRDLEANKFVDSGFANPSMEISVTSDSGKRVEKVSIAKSGSDYLVRRENDPTLYQLDASSIDGLEKAADDLKPVAAPAKK